MSDERQYAVLGPLPSSRETRSFLGVEVVEGRVQREHPVVVAWLPASATSDPKQVARLQRETAFVTTLAHPHIVRVHGLECFEEGWARVTDFADAESLLQLIDLASAAQLPVPAEIAARIVADAASAVAYAHATGLQSLGSRPVVHGAVRPDTLLVGFDGRTRVSGYGAGPILLETTGEEPRSQVAFLAPEQIIGGRSTISQGTDIYGLGATLYTLLTRQLPFADAGDLEQAILAQDPVWPSMEGGPARLLEVARVAMAKRGNLRFPTAGALRDAIVDAVGGEPGLAEHVEVATFFARLLSPDAPERAARRQLLEQAGDIAALTVLGRPSQPPAGVDPALHEASRPPRPASVRELPRLSTEITAAGPSPRAALPRELETIVDGRPPAPPQDRQATQTGDPYPRLSPKQAGESTDRIDRRNFRPDTAPDAPPPAAPSVPAPAALRPSGSPLAAPATYGAPIPQHPSAPSLPSYPAAMGQPPYAPNPMTPQMGGPSMGPPAWGVQPAPPSSQPPPGYPGYPGFPQPQPSSPGFAIPPNYQTPYGTMPHGMPSMAPPPGYGQRPTPGYGPPQHPSMPPPGMQPGMMQGVMLGTGNMPQLARPSMPPGLIPSVIVGTGNMPVVGTGAMAAVQRGSLPPGSTGNMPALARGSLPPGSTGNMPALARGSLPPNAVQSPTIGGKPPIPAGPVPRAPIREVSSMTAFKKDAGDSSRAVLFASIAVLVAVIGFIVAFPKEAPKELADEPERHSLPREAVEAVMRNKAPVAELPPQEAPSPEPTETVAGAAETAAPSPTDEPKTGTLNLSTEPPVDVYDGSRLLGRTPFRVELSKGPHKLRFTDRGKLINLYKTYKVRGGVDFKDAVTFGTSVLKVEAPAGAVVSLNGKGLGTSPLEPQTVYEGRYVLKVVHEGKSWSETFDAPAGKSIDFKVWLENH